MTQAEGRRGPRFGVVAALAAFVVVAGFAVGLFAGVFWQEPGLVIGYLTGETDTIDWNQAVDPDRDRVVGETKPADAEDGQADSTERATPPVAAPPPLGAARAEARAKPAPPPVSAVVKREVAPPPPPNVAADGPFAVQVGAFAERAAAQKLADRLGANGYGVYLRPAAGNASWRVRVGPLPSRSEAERIADRLKADEKLPTWVLSEDT